MIYFDNASTTRVCPECKETIDELLYNAYANPSSQHAEGATAKRLLEHYRETISVSLGANPDEIIFTSSGSEANTLAIIGMAKWLRAKGKTHIITSQAEHKSVLNSMKRLEDNGFSVTYLPTPNGVVDVKQIKEAITEKTGFASIMFINNEHGYANSITEIYEVCKANGVFLHSDCVQAAGYSPLNANIADAITVSGHKIHAPKGVGFLYHSRPKALESVICGGSQEHSLRGGTENLAFIGAFAERFWQSQKNCIENVLHIADVSRAFENALNDSNLSFKYNLSPQGRKIISVRFKGISGGVFVALLSSLGLCVSTGSACNSGNSEPQHALLAMGLTAEQAKETIRISFSEQNTIEEARNAVKIITEAVGIIERVRNGTTL